MRSEEMISKPDLVSKNGSTNIELKQTPFVGAELVDQKLNNVDVAIAVPPGIESVDDAIPEGGYGWVCVVCISLINANTWGVNSVSYATLLLSPTTSVIVHHRNTDL